MLYQVIKLYNKYPRHHLNIIGIFIPIGNSTLSEEQFKDYFNINFPILQFPPGSFNLPTPTILLYDQHGDIRYVQPPATTRAERTLFLQTVELIV